MHGSVEIALSLDFVSYWTVSMYSGEENERNFFPPNAVKTVETGKKKL